MSSSLSRARARSLWSCASDKTHKSTFKNQADLMHYAAQIITAGGLFRRLNWHIASPSSSKATASMRRTANAVLSFFALWFHFVVLFTARRGSDKNPAPPKISPGGQWDSKELRRLLRGFCEALVLIETFKASQKKRGPPLPEEATQSFATSQ